MPVTADKDRNFLYGLSDFWTAFFQDTAQLRAYYDGVQLSLGQAYLDLLQGVLGTSLRHMPLFDKKYFKLFTIREDQLLYREGATVGEDSYVYFTDEEVVDVPSLMNRVIAPTALLEKELHFTVAPGALRFSRNLFNTDGANTPEPLFPVRVISTSVPAEFHSPGQVNWATGGAQVGDTFRFKIQGGSAYESLITGIEGSTLLLQDNLPEFSGSLYRRTYTADVMRTPYAPQQVGEALQTYTVAVDQLVGQVTAGTNTINVGGDPHYQGPWVTATSYSAGDYVDVGGFLWRAKVDHVSGVTFNSAFWLSVISTAAYVYDTVNSGNEGMTAVYGFVGAALMSVNRGANFTDTATVAVFVSFYNDAVPFQGPRTAVEHTYVDPGSMVVVGRRAHPRYVLEPDGTRTLYPAFASVIEGVDYLVYPETGEIVFLTGWVPTDMSRASYTWRIRVTGDSVAYSGSFGAFTPYNAGDVVEYMGMYYVALLTTAGVVAPTGYPFAKVESAFLFGQQHTFREMAFWSADVLIDNNLLYNNFGYLLSSPKTTSEQYRTFLRGVSQLFLIGPTFERFESALNVMAGYPVIRDDGEVLRSYDSGVTHTGSDGQLIDSDEGRDGTLTAIGSIFTAASANFYASDVGAIVRVRNGGVNDNYVVTSIISPTSVAVSPPIPADAVNLEWSFQHVVLTRRFRATAGSRLFTPDDIDGYVRFGSEQNARNRGLFRIEAVENSTTVILESPYGFIDEASLDWSFSRANKQTIVTSSARYDLPLLVPVKEEIKDTDNWNVLTFTSFDTLTTAFVIDDYIRNETWWHDVTIPPELLSLQNDSPGRRRVTPQLIEHLVAPLDQAVIGDFGLVFNEDDERHPGIVRSGPAKWFGGSSVVLDYPANMPVASGRDVDRYAMIRQPGFAGDFRITNVSSNGLTVTLENFPPVEAGTTLPPLVFNVALPTIVYRRTVAFVMMDRFLKYHAVRVQIDPNTPLTAEFVTEVTGLIKEAKPSHVFMYLEPITDFVDRLNLEEKFELAYGPYIIEKFFSPETLIQFDGSLEVNEAFMYVTSTNSGLSPAPGTYALTATPPYSMPYRQKFVFVRVNGLKKVGGAPALEGVNWAINYATNTITYTGTQAGDPIDVIVVSCFLRIRNGGDTLLPFETRLVVNGSNPTIKGYPGQQVADSAFHDRAVQISITP